MARTVGDFVLERVAVWGVRRVFGYPGDGIDGITTALARNLFMALARGDSDRGAIFNQLFKQLAA